MHRTGHGLMKGYLYIIQSQKNLRYYIGSTNNLTRRLREHNLGLVKYTSLTRPWRLVYHREFQHLKEARQTEYQLKRQKSRRILEELILGA